MDPEIPWLGSGAESADRIIWGKADGVFIRKKKPGRLTLTESRPSLIPSAFKGLPEKPSLIPEAGWGKSPQKAVLEVPFFDAKNTNRMYKHIDNGYTINRKGHRQ